MAIITCARCGVRTRPGRRCPSCSVFLCGTCARKGVCPADGQVLQKPKKLWVFLLGLGLAFVGFSLFAFSFEWQSYERASIPTTPIAALAPGTTVKLNGTIEAATMVVIDLQGSGDNHHWVLTPFRLGDASGSISVDVTDVQGSTSFWVIERGRHNDDWWVGDAASIIGRVASFPNGTRYVVANFIARTPVGFAGSGLASIFFASTAAVSGIPGAAGFVRARRNGALHERNSGAYRGKVEHWRSCGECGELLGLGTEICPSCNAPQRQPSRAIESLPTLRFVTAFRLLSRSERVAALTFTFVLPPILTGVFLWIAYMIGLARSLQPVLLLLPISAIVFPLVFGPRFLAPQRITLGPYEIDSGRAMRHESVLAREVDRVLTIRRGVREVHFLITRGDLSLGFGPGLTPADFEASRTWIRNLAGALGVRYQENLSFTEAISFMSRRAS